MGVREAFRLYKKATFWSVLLSTAVVMEGYDIVLLANLYEVPAFAAKYGDQQTPEGPVISAPWRTGLSSGALIGEIIGLMFTGVLQDRFGYKKSVAMALLALCGFIFIVFFAVNLPMLLVGEILCGTAWGVFQTITTAYASEVTPVALRSYLTAYVNLCWVIGQLIGSGVLRAILNFEHSPWSYRAPFAGTVAMAYPALRWLCSGARVSLVASETWQVSRGQELITSLDLAGQRELRCRQDDSHDGTYGSHRAEINAGTSYWDCFKGTDLRRTEIVCVTWLIQNFCGSVFMCYSTVFYTAAGLDRTSAFDLSLGQYGIGFCANILSWVLMGHFGRRSIYLGGVCALCAIQATIGVLGIWQEHAVAQWTIGSMLLGFAFVFNLTVGPICYSLVAELSSTRLKAKTIVLARNVFNVGGIVTNTITNYQLTTTAWNWGAYSGFFWAGCCVLCINWIYFRLPEPKNRSYGELDILFQHKVPARKFKETQVSVSRQGIDYDFDKGQGVVSVVEVDSLHSN